MNITHVRDEDVPQFSSDPKDNLSRIFEAQRKLMEKYADIEARNLLKTREQVLKPDLTTCQGQQVLKDHAWRVTEELGEAMNCLKNKPWKQTPVETDWKHYYEELADAFHFFTELCIISGLTSKDLFELYFKKNHVNQFRQQSNY